MELRTEGSAGSPAAKQWLRWSSALAVAALLLFLGSLLLSWFIEGEVAAAVKEIGDGMKKSPLQITVAPNGSKVVWQGDSVGAVMGIVRSPASRDSDTLVLFGTLDSAMAGVRDLSGFVSGPISETEKVVVDLRVATDTAGLDRAATLWSGQAPRPIPVFEIAPDTRGARDRGVTPKRCTFWSRSTRC